MWLELVISGIIKDVLIHKIEQLNFVLNNSINFMCFYFLRMVTSDPGVCQIRKKMETGFCTYEQYIKDFVHFWLLSSPDSKFCVTPMNEHTHTQQ